jgi:hypothetical protein
VVGDPYLSLSPRSVFSLLILPTSVGVESYLFYSIISNELCQTLSINLLCVSFFSSRFFTRLLSLLVFAPVLPAPFTRLDCGWIAVACSGLSNPILRQRLLTQKRALSPFLRSAGQWQKSLTMTTASSALLWPEARYASILGS